MLLHINGIFIKSFSFLNVNICFSSYKAQGVVEDVTNRIVDHIRPGPYRLDWDSLMTTMDIMETFEEVKDLFRFLRQMCIDAYMNLTVQQSSHSNK